MKQGDTEIDICDYNIVLVRLRRESRGHYACGSRSHVGPPLQ